MWYRQDTPKGGSPWDVPVTLSGTVGQWDRAHLQNLTDECATMVAHWTSGLILKIIFALSINETVETYSLLCSYTVVLEQIFY